MSDQVFVLPDLGEGLTEAEIVRWLVAVGEELTTDQPIAEVETAKSIVEVPTPYAGRVARLHGAAGDTIDVGAPLITVTSNPLIGFDDEERAEGEAATQTYRTEELAGSGNVLIGYGTSSAGRKGRTRRPRTAAAWLDTGGHAAATILTSPAPAPAPAPAQAPTPAPTQPPRVLSPLVRRYARDHGVDLALLAGSGAGNVITRADVENAVEARAKAPASGERRIPISGFRKAVATALGRSRSEIPEATVWVDVDATDLVAIREQARLPDDPGPGLLSYLARFTVDALTTFPVFNGRVDTATEEFVEYDHVNLALAVQTERGLVTPAVLGAEQLTGAELDRAIRELTARAQSGRATSEELTAGTFTVNNYGSFNVDGSAAIINHPQVGIVGFGRIIDRPWVVAGQIVARRIMQMSFVFDHRICDGQSAAGFMRHIADAVENPAAFLARR
jgi:2-oxoisovalerate dehydrogenase E2 component (dihydrolipoyl transacylase)